MNIMKNFTALALLLFSFGLAAQSDGRMNAILFLCGAGSEEELDEQEVERYHSFLSDPLEINFASRSRMLSSGLMSQYQVASLQDYISRTGDVLSVSELASIDGFGEDYANALAPFVSFRSKSLPGQKETSQGVLRQEALVRSALKDKDVNYGAKYRLTYGDVLAFSAAARTKYSDKEQFPPSAWSMNMTCYGRKGLGKVIIGDFNARFGQGLALWSGMSLSGLPTVSSFSKRPSGLSPSWSWSGAGGHRGVAADFTKGRAVVSAFASFPGLRLWCESGKPPEISLMTGANIAYYARDGQFSLTGGCLSEPLTGGWRPKGGKLAGDFRWSRRGVDYFGEAAWDFSGGCLGFILGSVIPLGGDWRLAAAAHGYPSAFDPDFTGGLRSWTKTSDEYGLTLGLEKAGVSLSADFAVKDRERDSRQIRANLKIPLQLTGTSVLSFRLTERLRPYEPVLRFRTGARCDLDWSSSGLSARYGASDSPAWKLRARAEGLLCRSLAWLGYLEGGRKAGGFSAYLRGTIFIVDNWDDRIYSYERDAPGNFTVPAYYGRGWSVAAVAGKKFAFGGRHFSSLKIYLRLSATGYSFMKEPKSTVSEGKVQAVMSF